MSHYTTLKTKLIETGALIKALSDVGFSSVEIHDKAQHLYGYQGDERRQTAEVIVRREFVGHASNDIGFKRNEDGVFDAIISGYDRSKFDDKWLRSLMHRYAYHAARDRLQQQGFDVVSEEKNADGQVHLVLRRIG